MSAAIALLWAAAYSFPSIAQEATEGKGRQNYIAFELERDDYLTPVFTEDMNGDGRADIIIPHYEQATGRELHIHHQRLDGGFSDRPQRIEVKTEIVAIGFADLRDDPGTELVLFAADGVFSLSTSKEGYVGNLKPLVQWRLIATVPNQEYVQFVGRLPDVNGDGEADLLLPGRKDWALFHGIGGERFKAAARFTTLNEDLTSAQRRNRDTDFNARIGIDSDEGVIFELQAETPSPYAGFLESWRDEPRDDGPLLLNSRAWLPNASFTHLDTGTGPDLVYLNTDADGLGRLHIHSQQADGGFKDDADWVGSIDISGEVQLMDFNGDGLQDLLRLAGDGNEWVANFYLNQNGGFDLETPQQVMRFGGYNVRLEPVPIATRKKPVLSVSYYTIPVVEALRSASVNRVQLIYDSDGAKPGQLFNRRPATRLEDSFSAESVRGLAEPTSLRFDVDGDGRNDALFITANGTLAARRINDDLSLDDDPFWEYVSSRIVFGYTVTHLNDDALPDLLLQHGTVTTFLTAVP